MALLGISLLVASVVYVMIRPPAWMPPWYLQWRGLGGATITPGLGQGKQTEKDGARIQSGNGAAVNGAARGAANGSAKEPAPTSAAKKSRDEAAMPPPPPPPTVQPPTIEEPEDQTTPKAGATEPAQPVPSFTLSEEPSPPPARPTAAPSMPPPPPTSSMPPPRKPSSSSMAPPPAPSLRPPPAPGRLPTLQQFPAASSPQRAAGPVPNRGAPSSSSGLAPPPTHSAAPKKPSRKVLLSPGHSPLDWARMSGPGADLRGLDDPSLPYLRVTPSMLRRQTGRKGTDAWMALNGRVYNVSPYADFHPGGVPELMRGAGRDGTKLFGEIHPWVNYETMLSACLVGLLVEEGESEMDKMD